MALKNKNRFSILENLEDFPEIEIKKKRTRVDLNFFNKNVYNERYLIMRHAEEGKNLKKVSCFIIDKSLNMITNKDHIAEVRRIKSGDLLIISKSEKATNDLLKATNLGGFVPIKVEEHPFLNKSKGVVSSSEFLYLEENEILEELKSQNVIEVYKIKRRINNELVNTNSIILTFDTPNVPSEIKAGFINAEVRIYIPNPMRCKICQKYGHSQKRCQALPKCYKCSEVALTAHTKECGPLKCVNCEGPHESIDRSCPKYLMEKEITRIKTVYRLPYFKAKEKYFRLNANTTPANTKATFSEKLKNTQEKVNEQKQDNISSTIPPTIINKTTITKTNNATTVTKNMNIPSTSKSVLSTTQTPTTIASTETKENKTIENKLIENQKNKETKICLAKRFNLLSDNERNLIFGNEQEERSNNMEDAEMKN